jgi:hypothetical protein
MSENILRLGFASEVKTGRVCAASSRIAQPPQCGNAVAVNSHGLRLERNYGANVSRTSRPCHKLQTSLNSPYASVHVGRTRCEVQSSQQRRRNSRMYALHFQLK